VWARRSRAACPVRPCSRSATPAPRSTSARPSARRSCRENAVAAVSASRGRPGTG
jgi:hypothetical protein